MSQAVFEHEEDYRSLKDYLAILKRRKFHLIVPAICVGTLALMVTFALPARYQSEATILIEEQEVPREFVTSTITSFAAQQIQMISQRVLTADSIAGIADKYGLYTDGESGARPPSTQIAEAFRKSMTLDLVSADVIDPRSGRPTEATIAFNLAFEHPRPGTAQKVTNELVTLFLDENLRTRTERAANTEAFLSAEAASLNQELLDIEQRLADFKQANEGALPELHQFNLNTLERASREISDIDLRLRELEKRKLELSAELTQIHPWGSMISSEGQAIPNEQDRLVALRAEYRQKAALYKPNHPGIVRLEREIEQLEVRFGARESPQELSEALELRTRELAEARQRYQEDSVQVKAAQRLVADLERRLKALETRSDETARSPSNPVYVLLDTQRKSAIAEANALREKREELRGRIEQLETLISRAPEVEKEYQALLRNYQTTQARYQEVRAEQREAKLAENLEQERKGERFVLVEPPNLPLDPSSPNRPALAVVGLILALASGAGLVLLMEAMDSAIYGEKQLTGITGTRPFAVVSYIENSDDLARRALLQKRLLFAAGAAAILFVVFFHFFVKPLDVAWFMLMNRLGW